MRKLMLLSLRFHTCLKISKALKAKSSARRNSLRLKRICARHSRLGELKAKILTVFLPRFSRLFCLLSSKILQNNLLDVHLVEICRYKLSFYAKTSQILLTTHRHFSTFLKNRCVKLKTRRGLELGT